MSNTADNIDIENIDNINNIDNNLDNNLEASQNKIELLDDFVINCIAAGEVVQRPDSVVRELVDNAVDAGATQISIHIEEGGSSLIRVVDNGCGMSKEDAINSFKRHATSKIKTTKDLDNITTMGFRGEALASIAAVSKVRLKTRDKNSVLATQVLINGGELVSVLDVAGNQGTDIEIRNLFYNVPARKKFLRQPKTEALRIKNWVRAMVLAYPHIRVSLFIDAKDSIIFAARDDVFKRAGDLYEGSIVKYANKISELSVKGIVAHPALAKSDVGSFIILVNKRLVVSRMLLKAVREGFKNTLKGSEIPVGFLDLEIAPHLVDVNVHPQKMEIRFTNESAVFSFVRNAVDVATSKFTGVVDLANLSPIKNLSFSSGYNNSRTSSYEFQKGYNKENIKNYDLNNNYESVASENGVIDSKINSKIDSPYNERGFYNGIFNNCIFNEESFKYSNLKYIGQLFKCYLLCEYNDEFYIVDMHAGHERVNYNKIKGEFLTNSITVQDLMIPISVELGEEKTSYLLNHKDNLEKFGIYIESFGSSAVVIRALPQIVGELKTIELIHNIANVEMPELAENMADNLISDIAARIACHSSVRSGKSISNDEVIELFKMLDSEEFSSACPHGRPVIRKFSKREVECWFGRDR
ncbi:MAG: DNA mismatch repair endonuclease MutL [Bdellovibrionota bacterium]